MTQPDSFDWRELGNAWRRGGELPSVNAGALRQRLDRQRVRLIVYTTIEIAILLGALAWGVWLLTRGKLNTTLAGWMVISLAVPNLALIWWARRGSFAIDDQSVQGMLDLAIARVRGSIRYVQSVYLIGALAIVAVSIIVTIRAFDPSLQIHHFKRLVLACTCTNSYVVVVLAVAFYHERKIRRRLEGFIRMRESLVAADGGGIL